ncbi:MAG: HAMP domain-containing protein [Niveispirillum sp.]|nr:HAMP domain-containing protein [Niveispirillum sp.]
MSAGLELRDVSNTASLVESLVSSADASNRQIEADMMHDAIARDVMAGLLAQQRMDQTYLADARKRMENNIADFTALLDSNARADLPAEVRVQVVRTQAELKTYAATARRLLDQNHASEAQLGESVAEFDQEYDRLAAEMEKASDVISTNNQNIADTAISQAKKTLAKTIVLALAGIGFLTVVFWTLGRTIVSPLLAMITATRAYAREHYDIEPKGRSRKDEIGDLARSIDQLRLNSLDALKLRQHVEKDRLEAERARNEALQAMAEKVETETRQAVSHVAERTSEMNDRAGRMALSAGLVSESSTVVAAAAQQTLQNSEAVASATEQLSASISEIASQVTHATEVTRQAVQRGNGAADMINQLGDAVGRINEVTRLISEIASQTNLLALNATIEAARAGEMGKGFAVVASEVKSLANQTAQATEDITRQVAEIQAATTQATDAVLAMTRSVHEVDDVSTIVAAAVEEQGAATAEIARNVAQAAAAARETAHRIATVSEEARNAGEQAGYVSQQTSQVADAIQELRQTLVRVVRTATVDVDRRSSQRLAIIRPITLLISGRTIAGMLQNISTGGALVEGADLAEGTRGRLDLGDGAAPLDFTVLSGGERGASLRFTLPEEERGQIDERLSRLSGAEQNRRAA